MSAAAYPPAAPKRCSAPSSSAARRGVGLGLSISRRAITANGGEIHVQDLPGKGCVFTVDLPMAAPSVIA